MFSCDFCEIFKNTFFHRTPLVTAGYSMVFIGNVLFNNVMKNISQKKLSRGENNTKVRDKTFENGVFGDFPREQTTFTNCLNLQIIGLVSIRQRPPKNVKILNLIFEKKVTIK